MKQKTKKIILLISTILTLLVDIACALAVYTGVIQLEAVGDSSQISNNTQLALFCICALVNLIGVIFILKDLIIHKKKLIILNVIQLLLGSIFSIASAIINICILSSKTKDVNEVKIKKELPVLEDITKHKWYVYFIIFIFLFIISYTPFINILPIPDTKIATIITIITFYVIQLIALVIPMFNELKRDFSVFKNNFKLYLSKMLPRFGIVFIVYFICSILVSLLVGDTSNNQQMINSLPLYISAFLAIIIAPITEELMFRGFIRKFIKNNILFLILSSLIFGGLHVTSADSWQQVLFIIPYSILGFAFAQNYTKTKNIASNIFLHSLWNSIAVIAMALVKFL